MTPKQEKLVEIINKNLKEKGLTKTLGEMLLEAGYSEDTSEQPSRIIESPEIQNAIEPTLDKMRDIRARALQKITDEKLDAEKARDLGSLADIMTKNIQLLSGGETERQTISIQISEAIAKKNGINNLAK